MATIDDAKRIIPLAFPKIREEEVNQLISNAHISTYQPGFVLCRENAIEDVFYIILEGEVEITKVINFAENRVLKHLGAGGFFGEMALIHDAPRAATVTTVTPTTVLEIRKDDFDRVLESSTTFALAMAREISRRLRENDQLAIEDLRMRANELARAYQQLAEIDFARREFLTTIAHELRTPLMAANGFVQAIRVGMISSENLPASLDTISNNLQQIISLTNDLLFLQEMDLIFNKEDSIQLMDLIQSIILRLQDKATHMGVRINFSPLPKYPQFPGDLQSLDRAFTALIDNAIKFSPAGGDIDIIPWYTDDRLHIIIRDHGVGIPAEAMPKIFDRFFHIEEVEGYLFRGVGLGLSIARQVIEQHGGNITAQSKLGKGSTFTVAFLRPHPQGAN